MLQQSKTHDRKIAQPLIHENEQSITYINLTIQNKKSSYIELQLLDFQLSLLDLNQRPSD